MRATTGFEQVIGARYGLVVLGLRLGGAAQFLELRNVGA